MGGFFYNLGKFAGPSVRKGKWLWRSLTGSDEELIRAETEVGADLACTFRAQLGEDTDPEPKALVQDVAARLVPCVKNKLRRFEFVVAAQGEPNAFALPGGFVFLTRSLVELLKQERDELAFVMGHEMAHVMNQDPMQRIVTDTAIGAAVRALPGVGRAGGWLKTAGARILQSTYSQDRELEADRLGVRLVHAAHLDHTAAVRFLERLGTLRPQSGGPPAYFSSHPPFTTRIAHLGARADGS